MGAVRAARSPRRPTTASTGATSAKRTTASQAGSSQPRASLVSGTVRPKSRPAAVSAARAERRVGVGDEAMLPVSPVHQGSFGGLPLCRISFGHMARTLDQIDARLVEELQRDADRTNAE